MSTKSTFKNKAFTLIELLVVISILSLIASILLSTLGEARTKARDSQRVLQVAQIRTALDLYYSGHGEYPPLDDIDIDDNWSDLLDALEGEGLLANLNNINESSIITSLFFSVANALNIRVQDPLYPAESYGYMVGKTTPANQNYRLRVKFEKEDNPLLANGLSGYFLYTDELTGKYACDKALDYYCVGPQGDFSPFLPGKPVIYLYPTKKQEVTVHIWSKAVTESIPLYKDGWRVVAYPDGTIYNPYDGKNYPYLFWEGKSDKPKVDKSKGFIVKRDEVDTFLFEKLEKMGLIENEIIEFVEYWAPRMKNKDYTYVYFMPRSDYDELIPMEIKPRPDTIIRVYMLFKSLDKPIEVEEQELTTVKRDGFTVVEWGGDRSEIK